MRFPSFEKGEACQSNLITLRGKTWSKKGRLCVKLSFTWRILNFLVLKYLLAYLASSVKTSSILKCSVYIKLKDSWLRAFLRCMSQTSRDRVNSRRVRTHEKNSGDAVRRLGTIIQSIFCAQSGTSIRLTVWKWSGKTRYPGAFPLVLENFCSAFSPGPTDCPWVSEDVGAPKLSQENLHSLKMLFLLYSMLFLCKGK